MNITTDGYDSLLNSLEHISLSPGEEVSIDQVDDGKDSINPPFTSNTASQQVSFGSLNTIQEVPLPRCDHGELLDLMAYYYRSATTSEQGQICLNYINSYQHYNGEFSELECKSLGYPVPLCAAQKQPGYIRTEYRCILDLISPWLLRHLTPHLRGSFQIPRKKEPIDYMKVSSKLAPFVLKALFSKNINFIDLPTFLGGDKQPKNTLVFIKVMRGDLKKQAIDLIQEELHKIDPKKKVGGFRVQYPNVKFVFALQDPDIDLTVFWGAKWTCPKKKNDLCCLSLDDRELFGSDVYSWLNEMGAVPDRLAINHFITHDLGEGDFEADLKSLGVSSLPRGNEVSEYVSRAEEVWNELIVESKNYDFNDDPGVKRTRDAILLWNNSFFKKNDLISFAAPLLLSQVGSWISDDSSIVQWTKAYQNLCEIVMFCLEMFPELCKEDDFQKAVLAKLDAEGAFPNTFKSVGLYSYAMPAIFETLYQIIHRPVLSGKNPTIACITHSYFETLVMMKTMSSQGHISVNKAENLTEIEDIPDVLIADIHPNNAAKDALFQNDVAHWVRQKLVKNPDHKLILILDITLNNLSDEDLKSAFSAFNPFIENKQLELFCIYSLAKLSQLGADNFSGGVCIYVGDKNTPEYHPNFPLAVPHKARFYSLMLQHFDSLTVDYFQQVRRGTDYMHETLKERFSKIKEDIWIDLKAFGKAVDSSVKIRYRAMDLTLNVDEETVYIAINFKMLLKVLRLEDESKESRLVKFLRKLLLQLAVERNLPLTGRQSFGFSISNMNNMCDTIRFTIGIENDQFLNRYADLVEDFCYALSKYTAVKAEAFDFDEFSRGVLGANAILYEKEPFPNIGLPLDQHDEYDMSKPPSSLGKVTLTYRERQLQFTVSPTGETVPCTVYQKWMNPSPECEVKPSELMKVFFQITCFGLQNLKATYDPHTEKYFLEGVLSDISPFHDDAISIDDKKSGIKIQFEPEFIVTLPEGQVFNAQQTYVRVKRLGNKPVRISKLNEKNRSHVFDDLVRYDLNSTIYEKGIRLIRYQKKPFCNYSKAIVSEYKNGGLAGVVSYLNELDLNHLPLPHNNSYLSQKTPFHGLCTVLEQLGDSLALQFTDQHIDELNLISKEKFYHSITKGVIRKLCKNCSEKADPLQPDVAHALAQFFSTETVSAIWDRFEMFAMGRNTLDYARKNADDVSRLTNYLTALFPLIKVALPHERSLLTIENSIPFAVLSQTVSFPPLQEYLDNLKEKIPDLIQGLSNPSSITRLLSFYARYPLDSVEKRRILESVASLPLETRIEWVQQPGFYYLGFSEDRWFMEEIGTDEPYFMVSEQEVVRQFFNAIGGHQILASLPPHEIDSINRWQKLTNIFVTDQVYTPSTN